MQFRNMVSKDAEALFEMLCRLDGETEYMMLEPGEREERPGGLERLRSNIEAAETGGDLLLAAVDEGGEIVGFIWVERGKPKRVRHTAYIVVGIRSAYRRRGIGTEFFERLDRWARENGVVRLELTVECENAAARALYEKQGFAVEGLRSKSMLVNGRLVDEYYMAKIIE